MKPYYDEDGITIYHGEALRLLRGLPEASVDVLLTDPPYSSGGQFRGDRAGRTGDKYQQSSAADLPDFIGDNRDQRAHGYWMTLWLDQARQLAKPGALCCMFTDWRQLPTATDALQAGGWVWRGVAVWAKPGARPQLGRFSAQTEFIVWGTNGPRAIEGPTAPGFFTCAAPSDRVHMTQKPVDMLRWALSLCPPGGLVLDPFMGTGSTLRAAKDLGLRAIGCEVSREWCSHAAQQLGQHVLDFGGAA